MSAWVAVTNLTRGRAVAHRVQLADRWLARLRGLLGRRPLRDGEGLLLVPCQGVHMFGMRYAVDVVFVDRRGIVVATYPGLAPGRRSKWHGRAVAALEVPAGTLATSGTQKGDALEWRPCLEAA